MAENNYNDSVDRILGELKKQHADASATTGNQVDDILASLGKGAATSAASMAVNPPMPEQKPEPTTPKTQQAEPAPAPQRQVRRAEQAQPTQAPPQKEAEPKTTPPELSGSIQMDEQFERFFKETVAVIPDEDEEERPGFFARFLQRYKPDEDDFMDLDEEEAEEEIDEPTVMIPGRVMPARRKFFSRFEPEDTETGQIDLQRTQSFVLDAQEDKPQSVGDTGQINLEATTSFDVQQERPAQPQTEAPIGQTDLMGSVPTVSEQQLRDQHAGSILFETEPDDDVYDEYDEVDEYETEQDPLPLRIFDWLKNQLSGTQEDGDETFEEPFQPDSIAEYTDPEEAPAVAADLATRKLRFGLRCAISAVLTVLLFVLSLGGGVDSNLPAVAGLSAQSAPAAWLGVQLVVLLILCGINWQAFANGLKGLVLAPSVDTTSAMAGVGSVIQLLYLLLRFEETELETLTIFAAAAALLLTLNALGHYLSAGVAQRNFDQLQTAGNQTVTTLLEDASLSQELAEGLDEPEPKLLVSRSTGMVQNILHRSFSQSQSNALQQKMAWALGGASLLSLILCMVAGHSFDIALGAFAGTLCLGGVLASSLIAALPAAMMQKSAAQVGAVIPGASAVAQLKEANVIVADAIDLVPPGSVRLHGIKTFDKQRIDLAILYAASVLIEDCEILKDVFMDIIQDKTEILYPVENLENHPGMGFSGWVENNRMLVGTREMMLAQGVEVPSMDFENRYTKGTKNAMYLAVSGQLFAMFTISYRQNQQTLETLHRLHRQGISVLIKSDDFNLTSDYLCALYDLPEGSVQVLNAEKRRALAPQTGYVRQSDACMAHSGSFASFVGGLGAAIDAALGERTAGYVLMAGVLFSCVLALVLSFGGGLASIGLPAVALYQAAWCVLTLVMTLLRRS